MPKSGVGHGSFDAIDSVAPGTPTFIGSEPISNSVTKTMWQLASGDADGTELTGLTKATQASLPMIGGVDPFIGLGPDEIVAMGPVVVEKALTPADAGTIISFDTPISKFGPHAVACWVQDD